MAQSYTNSGGNGDRTTKIVVTTTATGGLGTPSQMVNGTQANEFWWGNQSGREVKFDFSVPRIIDEAKWYQDNASTHGTWQWQGSNDNSAWTNIGATFTLGGTVQTITTLNGNVTAWRYYRMLQTAGTTSTSPYLREIEFSIDDAVVYSGGDARFSQIGTEPWVEYSSWAAFTQVGVELWRSTDIVNTVTQGAFTQVGAEVWITHTTVIMAVEFTQVGVEVWHTITEYVPPPPINQMRVMIMA